LGCYRQPVASSSFRIVQLNSYDNLRSKFISIHKFFIRQAYLDEQLKLECRAKPPQKVQCTPLSANPCMASHGAKLFALSARTRHDAVHQSVMIRKLVHRSQVGAMNNDLKACAHPGSSQWDRSRRFITINFRRCLSLSFFLSFFVFIHLVGKHSHAPLWRNSWHSLLSVETECPACFVKVVVCVLIHYVRIDCYID